MGSCVGAARQGWTSPGRCHAAAARTHAARRKPRRSKSLALRISYPPTHPPTPLRIAAAHLQAVRRGGGGEGGVRAHQLAHEVRLQRGNPDGHVPRGERRAGSTHRLPCRCDGKCKAKPARLQAGGDADAALRQAGRGAACRGACCCRAAVHPRACKLRFPRAVPACPSPVLLAGGLARPPALAVQQQRAPLAPRNILGHHHAPL